MQSPGDEPGRTDLYLSGGGYRAALGALGVVFFLVDERRWRSVRRVVSVSGGGLVNAHLAVVRPPSDAMPTEIRRLFERLTDRSQWRRRVFVVFLSVLTVVIAAGVLTQLTTGSAGWALAVALVGLVVAIPFATRLWLFLLYRTFVGRARFDDLASDPAWPIEHVFTASNLTRHGSVFLVANCIQPMVGSTQEGTFDGRGTSFVRALRATTALPPILPPVRFKLRSVPPARLRRRLGDRPWVSKPEPGSCGSVWLADGGLTGNLGVQLDGSLAPDNVALIELLGSTTKAHTPGTPQPCDCPSHEEIAWLCRQCHTDTLIVDCSGLSPRPARWVHWLFRFPVVGAMAYALRSLHVVYESSLVDDQSIAGRRLIGVVRADQLADRLAIEQTPRQQTGYAPAGMVWAGKFVATRKFYMDDAVRDAVPGVTPLVAACLRTREEVARVPTRLAAVDPPRAARIVASGYLNACLTAFGPDAIDRADQGVRRLSELLGPAVGLDTWWAELAARSRLSPPTTDHMSSG